MKKDIIETLTKLVNKRLDIVNEYKKTFLDSSEQVKIDINISHLKECIEELNKLNNFEFLTDKEIEKYLKSNGITINTENKIIGAKWMREQIKSKLNT